MNILRLTKYYKVIYFFSFITLLCSCAHTASIISINFNKKDRSEKEAIVIMPGFLSILYGNRDQEKYFIGKDTMYDVFIPKYIGRKSVDQSLDNFEKFISKNKLNEYKKIHVFGYIIGGWVLNQYIQSHPDNNIASIIYDRSPLQERAPYVVIHDKVLVTKIMAGKIIWDFNKIPYPAIENSEKIKIGIIIESKATKLIRTHKERAMELGELKWDVASLKQPYDDYMYTWLNHDDMYSRFDVIGEDIFYFIHNGHFSSTVRRQPYDWDPFEIYQEQKIKQ